MTDEIKDLVERLRKAATPSEFRRANPTLSDAATATRHAFQASLFSEAADALSRIAVERDEALTKVKREQEAWADLERANRELFNAGVEDIRALRAAAAERERLAAMVERAFRDGIAYASLTAVTDPDEAWRTSAAREALSSIKGKGSGVVE